MRDEERPDLDLRTASSGEINEAMTRGAHDALLSHKRAGNPVVVWEDGRVVVVPPEGIVIPEEEEVEAIKPLG